MKRITGNSLRAVVAIGIRSNGPGLALAPTWIGSGFIVGEKVSEGRNLLLVTNKHVIRGQKVLIMRLMLNGGVVAKDFIVPLYDEKGAQLFSDHPSAIVDIVAISLSKVVIPPTDKDVCCFEYLLGVLTLSDMEKYGYGEGSAFFALGFPMGMVDARHNFAICRLGCLAKIESSYRNLDPVDFLGDVEAFPGNSGGPAVVNNEHQGSDENTVLVGILHASLPYQEKLISAQTGRVRSVTEENSGLTMIHPVDRIVEVVQRELDRVKMATISRSSL